MSKVVVVGGEEGNFNSWWYHGGRQTTTGSVGYGSLGRRNEGFVVIFVVKVERLSFDHLFVFFRLGHHLYACSFDRTTCLSTLGNLPHMALVARVVTSPCTPPRIFRMLRPAFGR